MCEENHKYQTILGKITTLQGVDPNRVGLHYANMHDLLKAKSYQELGENIKTTYEVSNSDSGEHVVTLRVNHY